MNKISAWQFYIKNWLFGATKIAKNTDDINGFAAAMEQHNK